MRLTCAEFLSISSKSSGVANLKGSVFAAAGSVRILSSLSLIPLSAASFLLYSSIVPAKVSTNPFNSRLLKINSLF